MVLKLMMNATFVAKKTQSITLLFTAPLRNNSYKKSFCGSTQRTIHSSLQQRRNFIRNYLQLKRENYHQ